MSTESRRVSEADAFFLARADWLKVEAIDRGEGAYDIALVIDGTYHLPDYKADLVEYFTEWVRLAVEHAQEREQEDPEWWQTPSSVELATNPAAPTWRQDRSKERKTP